MKQPAFAIRLRLAVCRSASSGLGKERCNKRLTIAFAVILNAAVISVAQAQICGRTEAVRNAIVAAVSGVSRCEDVVPANHLNGATSTACASRVQVLTINNRGLTSLKAGDFADMNCLATLTISNNSGLTELPETIFNGLTNLHKLYLHDNGLSSLHKDVFSDLSPLEQLRLEGNRLTSLPEGVFSGLSDDGLEILHLPTTSGDRGVFQLTMGIRRVDDPPNDDAPVIRLTFREGLPFRASIDLSASGATVSPDPITVNAGSTESGDITITPDTEAKSIVVTPAAPSLPIASHKLPNQAGCFLPGGRGVTCYRGFRDRPVTAQSFTLGGTELRIRVFLEGALE